MNSYVKNIVDGVGTVLVGMKITWSHMFTKKVTIQYPSVKRELPDRVRNRLYVNMDDCIGCDQCVKACPVNCITLETVKAMPAEDLGVTSTGNKKRLWVTQFDIDIAKCCYCSLCVYPCPTECIEMTDVFEFSEYERQELIYRFAVMSPDEIRRVKENAERMKQEQEAKKAAPKAEAKKPTAPPTSGPSAEPAAPAAPADPATAPAPAKPAAASQPTTESSQ